MKFVHVITTLVFGGAEKLLTSYANVQAEEHVVHIVYFKCEPKLKQSLDPTIRVHHIALTWKAPFALRRLIKELNPDIVHSHLGHADLIGMMACYRLPVKYFLTLHNVYFKKDFRDELYYFIYRILLKYSVPHARVISVGKSVQEKLARKRLHLSPDRAILRRNAIADVHIKETKEQLREALFISKDAFVLLFVGRLAYQKSVHTVLEAMALVTESAPSIQCILVGEGNQRQDLEKQAQEMRLDDVVSFKGATLHPEKYFAASDVFVLPSLFEGLVTVILEAFRATLPVIASNVDGNTELVVSGTNGLLFEVGSAKDLAEKILLLYHNPDERHLLGKRGYETYKNNFDIRDYNQWLLELYKQ